VDVSSVRAVITGGASGLGAGTARRIVEAGGTVALLDLPGSPGKKVAAEIDGYFLEADVTDPESVEAAVDGAAEALGGIDVLLNAAGIGPAHRVLTRSGDLFPLELFEAVIRVNLVGAFDVTRRCAPHMAKNEPADDGERGVVINVASIAAFEGQIGQAAYSASKGGLVGMTLPLARDLASYGIRVVAIAPGIMDTPMIAAGGPELKEALSQVHMFPKRLGTPDDFASLAMHLISNSLINGEVIRLDAGSRMAPR